MNGPETSLETLLKAFDSFRELRSFSDKLRRTASTESRPCDTVTDLLNIVSAQRRVCENACREKEGLQ